MYFSYQASGPKVLSFSLCLEITGGCEGSREMMVQDEFEMPEGYSEADSIETILVKFLRFQRGQHLGYCQDLCIYALIINTTCCLHFKLWAKY